MREFPLLDLKAAWRDAHAFLTEVEEQAKTLFQGSKHPWTEMALVRAKVQVARDALGTLPPGILDGIAKEEADLNDAEANAYTGY